MLFITFINILCVILAYLGSTQNIKKGLQYAFILLGGVAAIRYDFGNDYMSYFDSYSEITASPFDLIAIINKEVWKEPGWALLCYVFKPIGGYFPMVAFISILQSIIVYKFISRFVPRDWWAFSVFIYTFYPSLFLLNLSMLRQGLASILFLWSFFYIIDKKIAKALFLIIIAWSIHQSALFLLPLVFIGLLPVFKEKSQALAIVTAVLMIVFLSGGSILYSTMDIISDFEVTQNYLEKFDTSRAGGNFGLGYMLYLVPVVLSVIYIAKANADFPSRCLVLLSCFVVFIDALSRVTPAGGRLGVYFEILRIASYPIVYKWIGNRNMRTMLVALFVFIVLYDYWFFFSPESIYASHYSTYQTIFSHI